MTLSMLFLFSVMGFFIFLAQHAEECSWVSNSRGYFHNTFIGSFLSLQKHFSAWAKKEKTQAQENFSTFLKDKTSMSRRKHGWQYSGCCKSHHTITGSLLQGELRLLIDTAN